mgnify:CR=1 FL=1
MCNKAYNKLGIQLYNIITLIISGVRRLPDLRQSGKVAIGPSREDTGANSATQGQACWKKNGGHRNHKSRRIQHQIPARYVLEAKRRGGSHAGALPESDNGEDR